MREPRWLAPAAVLIAHSESLARFGGAAGVRDAGLLDSALARPRNQFAYGQTDLAALAAAYAYGIVRNHPFTDGNKRAGFLCAALFLELNGFVFAASEAETALRTLALAAGEIGEEEYAAWLRANTRAS